MNCLVLTAHYEYEESNVYVMIDQISHWETAKLLFLYEESEKYTVLSLKNGKYVEVKETPEEIFNKMYP